MTCCTVSSAHERATCCGLYKTYFKNSKITLIGHQVLFYSDKADKLKLTDGAPLTLLSLRLFFLVFAEIHIYKRKFVIFAFLVIYLVLEQ